MNTKISEFFDRESRDPELQAKLQEIAEGSPEEAVNRLIEISNEVGTPLSVEEIAAYNESRNKGLSEEDLSQVSGGVGFGEYLEVSVSTAKKIALTAVPGLVKDALGWK